MNWIEQVAQHHKEYIKTIKSFGEEFYAEDLVQEMYIRFINKDKEKAVIVNGQVNKYYVYLTLRSLFVDFHRQKSRVHKVGLNEIMNLAYIDTLEEHEAFWQLCKRVNEETTKRNAETEEVAGIRQGNHATTSTGEVQDHAARCQNLRLPQGRHEHHHHD